MALIVAIWRTSIVNWDVWFGPLSWFADLLALVLGALFVSLMRRSDRPEPRRVPEVTRTVDLLIPTVNEPLSVLEPTVIGARNVRGARRVLVLDDGARPEIREMARRLAVEYVHRTDRQGAKAGNLNHGLRFTDADLIVTLDADHIPMPDFLEWTVGYFDDPTVAFVQTPQTFYNTESMTFRRRRGRVAGWHEQEMFYDGVQPAKNRSNSAFYTGTGAVLRRAALDSIGGFATGTSTEDIHTSIRLHARGWRSVYLPKPLAYGLEVDNLREFYRTRRRWAAGSLGLLFRSPDSPLRVRGLTVGQRLSYLSSMAAHLQGGQRAVFVVTPVAAVVTGVSPVEGSYGTFGLVFGAFLGLSYWTTIRYGRGHFHPLHNEVFTTAAAVPMIAGLTGVVRTERTFSVSAKRAGQRSGIGVKVAYLVAIGVCLVGLVRAVLLLLGGERLALASWAAGFLSVNLVVIVVFLVAVARYERRRVEPAYLRLSPGRLYRYVAARRDEPFALGQPTVSSPTA